MISYGVDGCRGGWILCRISDKTPQWTLYSNFEELASVVPAKAMVLVDVPIGLSDEGTERKVDQELRKRLPKGKKSSVFGVPCRPAVHASSYDEANTINRAVLGTGLSKQTWNICGKIGEVDLFLRKNPTDRFVESHPETLFFALANEILDSKKSSKGVQQRIHLLERFIPDFKMQYDEAEMGFKKSAVKPDDLLDATILALGANRGLVRRDLNFIVNDPSKDNHGISFKCAVL